MLKTKQRKEKEGRKEGGKEGKKEGRKECFFLLPTALSLSAPFLSRHISFDNYRCQWRRNAR
jgi:hypothetical protein